MDVVSLMYHRIGLPETDPWGLFVSPDRFEEQIAWIASNYPVIGTDHIQERNGREGSAARAVCLTFDDGYEDNFTVAGPILARHKCQATFFIPTLFLLKDQHFWWDVLAEIFLRSPVLPPTLSLSAAGEIHRFHFSTAALSAEATDRIARWKWHENPPSERCSAFLAIWNLIRGLSHAEQEDYLAWLVRWSGISLNSLQDSRPMNARQLQGLASSPLFRLGLHTHTHCDLRSRSAPEQSDELQLCRNTLREIAQVDTDLVSYPFGNYDQQTIDLSRKMKLRAGFTTAAGKITLKSDPLLLSRCQVGDWSTERLKKELDAWFSMP